MRDRFLKSSQTLFLVVLLFTVSIRGIAVAASSLPQQTPKSADSDRQAATLQPNSAVRRELTGGEEHFYQVRMEPGQYARVIVEQRGIDVEVWVRGTDGKTFVRFDSQYGTEGEEVAEMVADTAAARQLSVRSPSRTAASGQYEIRIAEMRAAGKNDLALHEIQQLVATADTDFLSGKYDQALQRRERAVAIGETVFGKDDPLVAGLLDQLGDYYDDKQDFNRAIALRERAVRIYERTLGEGHLLTVDLNATLAWLYAQTNEVAKAERLAQRTLEIGQKALEHENQKVAKALLDLAAVTRDPKKAEALFLRALMIAEKTVAPGDPMLGITLDGLGGFYSEAGDYQQAEQFLQRSLSIKEQYLGPQNIGLAVTLHNLGRLARVKKDYPAAEAYYEKAIAIIEKAFGPENPRLAVTLNNLANIYRVKGEYTKSLKAHLQVLRISESTLGPYHPLTLQSLGNIAKTYAAQGNVGEAIKFQSRVDAVIERNIEMNVAIGSERQKLSYLKSIAERTDRTVSLNASLATDDPTASALAALVLLQRKGRVLDAMSEGFLSLRQRSTPAEGALLTQFNETAAELARLVLNGPQSLSIEEHRARVHELEERKERLEDEISRVSAEFRAQSQPVTFAAVQSAIPPNASLIEFAIYRPFDPKAESNDEAYGESRYIAYVLRNKGEVRWRDLGNASSIDERIGSLRKALRDPLRRDVRALARVVDSTVMQPVRELIGEASQVLISPDGVLNLIPFEALVDENGQYLIQRYSITYLTSGRDLLRLQVPRAAAATSVVIADPSYGQPELSQTRDANKIGLTDRPSDRTNGTKSSDLASVFFAPLTGTAHEARAIRSFFPDAHTLLGREATESSLKQASAPRVLHIATHGFFLTDGPRSGGVQATRAISATAKVENPLLRAGLALAGANMRSDSGDDGILTALEASGLNLWGTRLVVLSACDTGVGEVKNGEGVYGLRRAFVLAGTETLVMSFWPVSDYVTRELMTAYYRGLKQGGGRGEALRQVKLRMLKSSGRQHPFYWAGFIQSGEWANLDGKR